jgi:hypothetical protein
MVDGEAEFARHLLLLVDGQAVGVVELERGGAGQHVARGGFFASSWNTFSATWNVVA